MEKTTQLNLAAKIIRLKRDADLKKVEKEVGGCDSSRWSSFTGQCDDEDAPSVHRHDLRRFRDVYTRRDTGHGAVSGGDFGEG